MKPYAFRRFWFAVFLCSVLGLALVATLAQYSGIAFADPDSNKAVVERLMTDVALNSDNEAFDAIFAEDFVGHVPGVEDEWGEPDKLAMRDLILLTTRALSDLELETDLLLAEGGLVAQRVTMRGAFTSEFFDTPPTDESIEVSFNIIYRFNDSGQIAEMWIEGGVDHLTTEVGLTIIPAE